jgi:hypothetical protein
MILTQDNRKLLFKLGTVTYGLTHFRNRTELLNPKRLQAACEAAGIAETYHGGCFGANYQERGDVFLPGMQDYALCRVEREALCSAAE